MIVPVFETTLMLPLSGTKKLSSKSLELWDLAYCPLAVEKLIRTLAISLPIPYAWDVSYIFSCFAVERWHLTYVAEEF